MRQLQERERPSPTRRQREREREHHPGEQSWLNATSGMKATMPNTPANAPPASASNHSVSAQRVEPRQHIGNGGAGQR